MHRNLSLCSSIDSKRARGEESAKQTLDAREKTQREEEEEKKRRTRVLLDFRFHPSVQSVVERFQKRRPVHVSSRFGRRRRRRQRRDRRRARDRFLQAITRAAFFAAAHDDDDMSRPSSLLYIESEEILIGRRRKKKKGVSIVVKMVDLKP